MPLEKGVCTDVVVRALRGAVNLDLQKLVHEDMKIVKETVGVFKEEILIIRDGLTEQVDYMRDTKHDLREDLVRMEKILDKVENDIDKVEDDSQALMDRTKSDARSMIDDANNRFNDKVSGMEGYVKRELGYLEKNINEKLSKESIDITFPPPISQLGKLHPISKTYKEVIDIFGNMGFSVAEGPDIETDFNNFTALNIPEDHPAREMQDTFYLNEKDELDKPFVLRTHTSPVQIRTMMNAKPPIKIIAPGRTYRCDSDSTHSPMFHQVEGLLINEDANMGHLKGNLINFCKDFFH